VGRAILESGIPRADIFVTTKLWNTERGYDSTLRAFDASLKRLNLDYIDLYLIHWPATKVDGDRINAETWRAFEQLHDDGLIRSLGLSNFLVHHLRPLLDVVRIKPVVNQIEFHPGLMQAETVDFCKSQGILVEAWGPLGSGRLLNNGQLSEMASRYGVSVAQLCIRWCLQHGVLPLPKSVNPARIDENANVFSFTISDVDLRILDDFPDVGSSGQHPDTIPF
jgi:diketogulonate reductase-like aldo/keto reductase